MEAGCLSRDGSAALPNDWNLAGKPSGEEQLHYFEAMFAACEAREWVRGLMPWDWPAALHPLERAASNDDYCPYGKPAGTKVRFAGPAGAGELLLSGVLTHEPILPQLCTVVKESERQTGEVFSTVSVGVSGTTKADHDAGRLMDLIGGPGLERVLLAHDSVTSYLGALGDRQGAVVAAGMGVVTLGVGRSALARVDGWGNIMGDAGSGHWMGREALDAVMRAHDGRGQATALTAVVQRRWPDVEEAYIALQSSPDRVRTIAGFARDVAELASTAPVAHAICVAAARELASSTEAALRRVADHYRSCFGPTPVRDH